MHLQGERLYRNYSEGEIIDKGEETVQGITFRYAIISPWKAVRPFELRYLKLRLNNVGIGAREKFDLEVGRKYSRLHWLSGELQIIRGLDGAVTLSRDGFVVTPEYEAMRERAASILRKWADYLETIDVAARDMTKSLRGGKQVTVAPKKTIVERNIKTLTDRGFTVKRVATQSRVGTGPVQVDRSKKEVTVYESDPGLEDAISIGGKKHHIAYTRTNDATFEGACRLNSQGDIEINTEYPLFRSKRYGDIFKKVYIIAALAKSECSSPASDVPVSPSQIDKEFKNF